jgi:hypothetical protein
MTLIVICIGMPMLCILGLLVMAAIEGGDE